MYGLLLENLAAFIKIQWGEAKWESVRRHCGIDAPSFSIHHVYAETIIPRLAKSALQILGVNEREFFEGMGVYFVEFVGQYGYDQVMSVLGRHMRDFLNGLDNLHEYLKFSYPKMRAPSFFCSNETVDGLILHYRSKRRGFIFYAMGQIKQVAKHFYDTDCSIEIISEEMDGETNHVTFQLKFDNRALIQSESMLSLYRDEQQLPVKPGIIFDLFPFCVVFDQSMVIRHIGQSLHTILKDLTGQTITETFEIVRPLISFTFTHVLERMNNIFELITVAAINEDESFLDLEEEDSGFNLRLKGQMKYMDEWDMMLYLASPVMSDLGTLLSAGLYINDLPLHDSSRDLILAGSQQSVELKLALDQEQQKSHKLEDSMKKLDEEMKKTDELLYQMIPKQVADRIRLGENPVETCEVYDMVSVLFSDVVTFTEICSRITPMQVVSMLNHMYSLFDQLTERNGVYKVETIGDAYMVVSGAPNKDMSHAERICDMALDMVDASTALRDPSNEENHLRLRVGCHSGTVVAGVVGLKMPRWCLFGDCVNTSSRMETTSEAGRIQISEVTKSLLPSPYQYEFRGEVAMKGKGMMSTYWLTGRLGRIALDQLQCNTFSWAAPSLPQLPGGETKKTTASISGDSTSGGAARFVKEKSMSVSESDGPARGKITSSFSIDSGKEGHLPQIQQAPNLSKMNLEAARQAVTRAMSLAKEEKKVIDEKAQLSTNAPSPVDKVVPEEVAASPVSPVTTTPINAPTPTPNPPVPKPAVDPSTNTPKSNPAPTSTSTSTVVKPYENVSNANPPPAGVNNPVKANENKEQANCIPVPAIAVENQGQENSVNTKATLNNAEENAVEANSVPSEPKKEGDIRKATTSLGDSDSPSNTTVVDSDQKKIDEMSSSLLPNNWLVDDEEDEHDSFRFSLTSRSHAIPSFFSSVEELDSLK